MEKENKEQKLLDAALKIYPVSMRFDERSPGGQFDVNESDRNILIDFIKSEAAKQFNSLNENEFRKIKLEFDCLVYNKVKPSNDDIFNFFKSHIQKQNNDAIEFAEWCQLNGWSYNILRKDWQNRKMRPFKTTQELYELFKPNNNNNK